MSNSVSTFRTKTFLWIIAPIIFNSIQSINGNGYCNWNNCNNNEVQGGPWCNQSKENCEVGCGSGAKWCTGESNSNTATTTRYWDCSGGACGCAYLPSHLGGDNGKPAHCYSNAMFQAPTGNKYGAAFYGTAAVSKALGGGDWMSDACGKCWKLTGKANVGPNIGKETTVVLRGANYCPPENTLCAEGLKHFDIAAPGFDVLAFSLANTCQNREPSEINGFTACEGWPGQACNCNKFQDPVLRAGCENYLSLDWDNANVSYEEVDCPDEMVTPCWEENGNTYPPFGSIPSTCASPTTAPIPPPPSPTNKYLRSCKNIAFKKYTLVFKGIKETCSFLNKQGEGYIANTCKSKVSNANKSYKCRNVCKLRCKCMDKANAKFNFVTPKGTIKRKCKTLFGRGKKNLRNMCKPENGTAAKTCPWSCSFMC
mmetsp:Transcript_7007/g.10049  ORF Transcript_7007/g.10049 Transcript_7007/m.10049 type:complete len:426 (-) Transcript_7007:99-1376(-)